MNSANSEATNKTRKIQNAPYPRRFALKLRHRRALSGDIAKRWPSGRTASPIGDCAVVSGTSMVVRSSTSDLSRLEVDARIHPGIGEVGQQIHQQPDQRQDVKRCEHHSIIAIEHALETEQADSVKRKDRLDQKRAREEGVHERSGESGNHNQHRIAEDMPVKHLALRAP